MDKSTHFKLLIILLFAFMANTLNLKGQGSCSSPLQLSNPIDTNISITDSVMWVKFTANNSFVDFYANPSNTQRNVNHIRLYSGNCLNLEQVFSSQSSSLNFTSLTVNSDYYIKVEFDDTLTNPVNIAYLMCPQVNPHFNITPIDICAGDTAVITDLSGGFCFNFLYNYTFDYSGAAPIDTFLNLSNYTGLPIAPFNKVFNTPGVYWVKLIIDWVDTNTSQWGNRTDSMQITVHDNVSWGFINVLSDYTCDSIFLVTDSSLNIQPSFGMPGGFPNGISWDFYDYNNPYYPYNFTTNPGQVKDVPAFPFTPNTTLPQGQYYLTMTGTSYCGDVVYDSINFFITGGTPEISSTTKICVGDTAKFIGKGGCPDFWNWDFGDGSTFTGNDTVYHQYGQVGTYQVSLQTNNGGDTGYFTIEVVQAQIPIITGYKNNCDSVVLYSIENFDTNYTYTWSTQVYNQTTNQYTSGQYIINGNSNVETANTANINWNTASFPILPDYVLVTVEAHLKGRNCSAISTMKITQCCSLKGYGVLHDTTIYSDTTFTNVNDIIINGTVTFNGGVTFDNSNILMGPLAKIKVNNSSKFEAINTTFQSKECIYMNDGIYAETQNDSIVFRSNSQLSSSINGLYSSHGAYLKADSSSFINNLIGIQIKDHKPIVSINPPPFTPGEYSITNCDFGVSQDPLLVLTYPYSGVQPLTGVNIKNVKDVTIGDSLLGGNKFYKLKTGIKILNSNVEIYNNEFNDINDITNTGLFSFVQGAIFVQNINSSGITQSFSKELVIGKSANSANQFLNCNTGVFAMNIKARVSHNTFDSCNVGIRLYEFTYNSRVDYNQISNTAEGILVHKPIGGYRNIKVRENNLPYSQTLKTGISIINVNSSYGDIAQIANNTIHFLGNQNIHHYGIISQGCNGIKVNSNNIGRAGVLLGNIANNWDKMVGIKTAQSQGCQITDNYIYSMGTGIWTNGSCNLTQYSCNDLIAYKYGFYFGQLSTISEQGHLGTWNTHNKWSTSGISGNKKLATDANYANLNWSGNRLWYYGPNYVTQYIPITVGIPGTKSVLPYQNSTDSLRCVGTTTGTGTSTGGGSTTGNGTNSGTLALLEDENIDPEVRDFLLEDIMQGLDYIDLLNEFRAYDAKFLYNMLAEDTTLMWLGGDKDVDYQEFFDSVRISNIGDFTKVYDLIEAEDYHSADSINNLIVPTSDIYTNLKTVLSIYLNTWCKGNYILSESDYNTLFDIANQTPYKGGEGVYTARIMINYNPDDYGVAFRFKPESVENVDKDAIKLYPNPAQDMLNIEFENPKGEAISGVLKVFNLSGQLIFEKQLNTNNAYYILDISSLTNGAYIFSIQINNKENTAYRHQSGKLIVLKP